MNFVNVLDMLDPITEPDPNAVVDWTDHFKDAIDLAVGGDFAGVLVPARDAPYRFRDPGANMNIDLRGVHNFVLMGEGPRSVLAMVGAVSWRLIHIGDATDVVIRDLYLDGSQAWKLHDNDDQLHLVVIGASIGRPQGARRISVIDCTLRQAVSDGVAIAPASSADPRHEFSDIVISGCHFLRNGRSGVSNQRLAKRVSILHNRFEGTKNEDIDMEPSGGLPDAGPSGYLILGNTMLRSGRSSVSVSLSGMTPESRSRVNTFAYNQIRGGRLGVHNAQDLAIVGNYIEAGPNVLGAVVLLSGAIERVLFADNSVIRPENSPVGTLMNVTSEQTDYTFPAANAATSVNVAANTLEHQGHRLQTGVGPLRASVGVGGALPVGLHVDVDYWAIVVDKDNFQLTTTPPNGGAPTAVNLTTIGSPTFT